jgi:hypothetical protein
MAMKGKVSKYIIFFLITLNLVSLFFLLKPNRTHPHPPKLTDVIQFEEPVKSKIDKLERIHFNQMNYYKVKIKAIRISYYNLNHGKSADKVDYDATLSDIAENMKKIEKLRFQYFVEIRNLCNHKQQIELDLFVQHMIEHESMRRPKGK